MAKETPIINILTYKLPYELTNQIYNEFQNRFREATYLIEKYKTYSVLQGDLKTVELILSLSIFHKRVITNLDAAVKFYGTITRKSQAEAIQVGSYKLTGEEKNKLLAVVLSYNLLIEKFSITPVVMEYYETRELLRNLIHLKSNLDNAQNTEEQDKRNQDTEGDIPF
jgi:hypothetical protein